MPHRNRQGAPDPFAHYWDVGPPPTPNDVLRWFKEAWPDKPRHPDLGTCVYVAQGVRIIRSVEEGRKLRKRDLKGEKVITAAKTGAGVFLKHAPAVLQQLEGHLEGLTLHVSDVEGLKTLITDERAHAFVSETHDKVEQARKAIGAALELLRSWSEPYGEADRLLWVRRHMQEAWERTDGSCPVSTSEDSPDVLFIKLALDSVGDHRKVESIARAFRPSRSRQRNGLA